MKFKLCVKSRGQRAWFRWLVFNIYLIDFDFLKIYHCNHFILLKKVLFYFREHENTLAGGWGPERESQASSTLRAEELDARLDLTTLGS